MMRTSLAYTARALLAALAQHTDDLPQDQKRSLVAAARRLFEFAWAKEPRDGWFIMTAIEAVSRTFETDPAASSALLRRVIEPDRIATFGYEELPWLAEQVSRLVPLDPTLVEEIYTAGFGHRETSRDTTSLGSGQILQLTSNRGQDYGMALFRLNLAFPEFLRQAPVNATRALISALEVYASADHNVSDATEAQFQLGELTARIRDDHSFVWDATVYQNDEPMKLLRSLGAYLDQLADDPGQSETRARVLRMISERNCLAIVWKRLLTTGTSHPNTIGLEIRELSWAVPILANLDTTQAAGEFLRAVFPLLPANERERVEGAILSIPDYLAPATDRGMVIRDRLLGCLDAECLTTEAARQLVAEFSSSGERPANTPLVTLGEATWSEFTEEDNLQRQGVEVSADPNRRVRELASPVKEFLPRHASDPPTPDEIHTIMPALASLHEALASAESSGVDRRQQDYAWGHLAEACNKIVSAANLSCDTADVASVRALLLEASAYVDPEPHDDESGGGFDRHPSWGSPSARVDAAQGLIRVARFPSCADSQVLAAISRLATDSVRAVRLQIASDLHLLHETAFDLMWRLVDQFTVHEQSRGVLQFFVGHILRRLSRAYPDRVAPLVKTILERMGAEDGSDEVRRQCISTLVGMYVVANQSLAGELLTEIADRPEQRIVEADWISVNLRGYLTLGPVEPGDSAQDSIRQRAFALMHRLLTSISRDHRELRERLSRPPATPDPSEDIDQTKRIARLADSITFQLFAASGALAEQQPSADDENPPLTPEQKRRFLTEAAPLLDQLSEFGFPHLVHELLETLESLIPASPADVFLRIAHVVRVGRQYGYQYEALAVNLIVKLVERYLADYRLLLRENDECRRALLDVLDIFVDAGWPQARRLTYHLEDVFR